MAALLPPEARRRLAETILRDLAAEAPGPRRFWREIRGSVPYPLCGEDAQACITRGRIEAFTPNLGTR
jgi:hypothetical protein